MNKILLTTMVIGALLVTSCSKKEDTPTQTKGKTTTAPVVRKSQQSQTASPVGDTRVIAVQSIAEFDSIVANTPNRLILADMYADWCKPCHMLAPIYAQLSVVNEKDVTFLKVDTDRFKELAVRYRVQGIPFVAFIKDGKTIDQVVGLGPQEMYQQKIDALK